MLSAIFTGTGTVVEKVALQRLPELHARRSWEMVRTSVRVSAMAHRLRVAGRAASAARVLALSLAPLSVAQPIFASGIVLLLVLSHFVLHDRLGRLEWVGVTTIVLALVVLGLSIDPRVDKAGGPASLRDLALAAIPTCARRAGGLRSGGPCRPSGGLVEQGACAPFRSRRRPVLRRRRARPSSRRRPTSNASG